MSLLFEPISINAMSLPHRIITGPMERGMANRDGTLTPRYISYLEARAAGGAGLIQVESTYVDPIGMGHLFQVGCHDDLVIGPLSQAVAAVHPYGAKLALELYLGGRETPSVMSQRQPIAPSVVRCEVLDPTPTPREMTRADIDRVIGLFCAAAARARSAGIDMIHLHGAHGYLVGSFVSPFSNRRTDEFGGSLENRARFPLMLVAALRAELGATFPLGYRMTADEFVPGGLHIDESRAFAAMLADASIDLVDVSSGFYESSHMIMQGSESPDGGFVDMALQIKSEVGDRALVSVAQRLSRPGVAECTLDQGIDMVSMSRAFHADPQYVNKRRSGRQDEITPCIACHHCVDTLEANLVSDCTVNPETSREYILARSLPDAEPRRVVVVGGGPAGMQAAARLAERGSRVTLIERNDRLGGQMHHAATVYGDFQSYIESARARVHAAGVEVRLSTAATAESLAVLGPDLFVMATGVREAPRRFEIADDVVPLGLVEAFGLPADVVPTSIVIAGGDWASCVLAVHLVRRGSQVAIVDPHAQLATERPGWGHEQLLRLVGTTAGLRTMTESTVERVGRGWVEIQSRGAVSRLSDIDLVVVGGRQSENALAQQLLMSASCDVLVIGDALRPRDVHAANLDALRVAVGPRSQLALV